MTCYNLMLYTLLENCWPDRGPARFAIEAAAKLGAHLNVLAPYVDVITPVSWESRSADEIEREDTERRQRLGALVDTIAAKARAAGVEVSSQSDWAHPFGLIPFVGDQARLHDLIIAGADQTSLLSERKVAEHVLFDAGRPVVVVPANLAAPFSGKRILVAWDHTRAAARALHDALPFLRRADEVVLTAIGGEKRFQTHPDPATIETALARKGLKARFEQVELGNRTIGQALQDQAAAHGADLLVMGAFGHSRLRDFILGGATREILDNPRQPVLMSH